MLACSICRHARSVSAKRLESVPEYGGTDSRLRLRLAAIPIHLTVVTSGGRGRAGHVQEAAAWRRPTDARVRAAKQLLIATSESMREHGVRGFPDPITAATAPSDPRNYSIVEGGNLWHLVPSTINVDSPASKQAANACEFH